MNRRQKSFRPLLMAVGAAAAIAVIMPSVSSAEPPAGKTWPQGQWVSIDQIDHKPFDELLSKYVDDDGYVDYQAWHTTSSDRQKLKSYLDSLSRADTRKQASQEAKLAFWINAYNAVTIEGILRVYPTDSIRNHTAKLFGYNIWKNLPLIVGGGQYSLEDIEHKILRKMGDPRIHFGIVCASVGCPRLLNEAYTAEHVDEQLDRNAKDFFSRKKNLQVDERSRTLKLSAIMDWFGSDFGSSQAQQLQAIRKHVPEPAARLIGAGNVRVAYLDYDWGLNDQRKKKE